MRPAAARPVPARHAPPNAGRRRLARLRALALGLAVALLAACAAQPEAPAPPPEPVDFSELLTLARLSAWAYGEPGAIKAHFSDFEPRVYSDAFNFGRFVLLTDGQRERQYIAIRGTADQIDVIRNLAYIKITSPALDISTHMGFASAANQIAGIVKPHLREDYDLYLTGHSMGGAIASLLHLHLLNDGAAAGRLSTVTFGQPKVTNAEGALRFREVDIVRVVMPADAVPYLPTSTWLADWNGRYRHIGQAVVLVDGERWVYLTGEATQRLHQPDELERLEASRLQDHPIQAYIDRLQRLAGSRRRVACCPF